MARSNLQFGPTDDPILNATCAVCHDPNCPTSSRARELAMLIYERDLSEPQVQSALEEVAGLLVRDEERERRAREEHPEWFRAFPVKR